MVKTKWSGKYENKRNGAVVEFVRDDPKNDGVIIKTSDGKINSLSYSTWKRWWKKVEETTVEEPTKEETTVESNLVPMPGADKLVDLKKEYSKTEPTKKSKNKKTSSNAQVAEELKNYIFDKVTKLNGTIGGVQDFDRNFRALQFNDKQFCKMIFGKSYVKLCFRNDAIKDVIKVDKLVNYTYNAQINFKKFDDETKNLIDKLLVASINFNNNSKAKKGE